MAEICCDVVVSKAGPRAARRRRIKLVAEAEAKDLGGKMRQLGCSAGAPADAVSVRVSDEPGLELEPRRMREADVCHPRYGVMSVCGLRREMEDTVSIRPDFVRRACGDAAGSHHFFGIYDGHGCSHVAALCRDRMHELVAEELSRVGSGAPPSPGAWTELMERSFSRIDSEVASRWDGGRPTPCCRCELQTCDNVGSTAVVAVVGPDRIVVANCGDSRAVLCRGGVPVPLSSDHKPDRPDELSRIEAAGGRVIYWEGARVLGVLAMSRAIGDSYLKPYVIPEPEVTVTGREDDDECLILGSDGLWDVVTNEAACDVARMCLRAKPPAARGLTGGDDQDGDSGRRDRACSRAATLLTKLALARHSADNVSVVVVDLRRKKMRL